MYKERRQCSITEPECMEFYWNKYSYANGRNPLHRPLFIWWNIYYIDETLYNGQQGFVYNSFNHFRDKNCKIRPYNRNTDKKARGLVLFIYELNLNVMTTMKHIFGLLFCLVCVNGVQSMLFSDDPCHLTPTYASG